MGAVTAAYHAARDTLTAAGITADIDPQRLTPPAAWIMPRRAVASSLCAAVDVDVEICLIAPGTEPGAALDLLDDLATRAMAVLAPTGDLATDEAVTLPGTAPLPCFRYTTTLTHNED